MEERHENCEFSHFGQERPSQGVFAFAATSEVEKKDTRRAEAITGEQLFTVCRQLEAEGKYIQRLSIVGKAGYRIERYGRKRIAEGSVGEMLT